MAELKPIYGSDCPVAVVAERAGRAKRSCGARSATSIAGLPRTPIERTALILVGPALAAHGFRESALYDPEYAAVSAKARPRRGTADPCARVA